MNNKLKSIEKFAKHLYADKDIMHDWSHIERIKYKLDELAEITELDFDQHITEAALYFHGIIYSHEKMIRDYLTEIKLTSEIIESIINIAWASQKESKPTTNEGLILHDAHMLEGGRNFEIIKSLITGSVRGQTLKETMKYIESNLLSKGFCYTKEGVEQYKIMKRRTREIFEELNLELGRK
jgi:uncharacterized protein